MPARYLAVTSYDHSSQRAFGNLCVESFCDYWPSNCHIIALVENLPNSTSDFEDRLSMLSFEEHAADFYAFEHKYKNIAATRTGFKYDAIKFAHKVYALLAAVDALALGFDYLIWLDADVYTFRTVPNRLLKSLTSPKKYMSYLGRSHLQNSPVNYSECGFMIFNLNHSKNRAFWNLMRRYYDEGALFRLREWHDSYIFDQARLALENEANVTNINISEFGTRTISDPGHIFVASVLGKYMDHRKGSRKALEKSPERTW